MALRREGTLDGQTEVERNAKTAESSSGTSIPSSPTSATSVATDATLLRKESKDQTITLENGGETSGP